MKSRPAFLLSLAIVIVFNATSIAASWQSPKTAEEFNNRGLERQNNGDLDGAIADYTTALTFKSKPHVQAALLEKGDLDGAIADYTRALEFESNDASIFYGRATARQKKNDLEGALADYTKTIELDPKHALAFANRGVVKTLLKKPDASADFEAAFRLDPSLKATYNEFYENVANPERRVGPA